MQHERTVIDPDWDLTLERELIGLCLLYPSQVWPAMKPVDVSDWILPESSIAFSVMRRLQEKSLDITLEALLGEITQEERNELGSVAVLSAMMDHVIYQPSSISSLVDRFKLFAKTRKARTAALSFAKSTSPQDLNTNISELTSSLSGFSHVKDEDRSTTPAVIEAIDFLEKMWKGEISQINTGINWLDQLLMIIGPLLIVLAARPSVGKTAFALQIWMAACDRILNPEPHRPAIFSLEMPKGQLAMRLASQKCGVNAKEIGQRRRVARPDEMGKLESDFIKLVKATQEILNLDGLIYDSPVDIDQLCFESHKMREQGVDLFIIDYFEKIGVPELYQSMQREEQLSYISGRLMRLRNELDCPIIVLAQMNREFEKRKDKIPKNSDLRGTGSLEQDANAILFITREQDSEGIYQPEGAMFLTKYREGVGGSGDVRFSGKHQLFHDPKFY